MPREPPPRLRRYDSPLALRSEAVHLRQQMGTAERVLWNELRDRRFRDLKFRRQHALGPFVADFYCVEHRLVVEIDGSSHDGPDAQIRDAARDEWMQARGIRVVRVPARLVLQDRGAALAMIERTLTPGPSPARRRGEKTPRADSSAPHSSSELPLAKERQAERAVGKTARSDDRETLQ